MPRFGDPDDQDRTIYKMVVNADDQYSIWPADRENQPGWREAGPPRHRRR